MHPAPSSLWLGEQFRGPMQPIQESHTYSTVTPRTRKKGAIVSDPVPKTRKCLECGRSCALLADDAPYTGIALCPECRARNVFRNSADPAEVMPHQLDDYYIEVLRYDVQTVTYCLQLLDVVAGPGLIQMCLRSLLHDNREYRFPNVIDVLAEAQTLLTQADVSPKPVAPRLFKPLFDAVALENDKELQKHWAMLLASAAAPTTKEGVLPSFVDVLKQLSPEHLEALRYAHGSDARSALVVADLMRLGLLTWTVKGQDYVLTNFGLAFFKACQPVRPK
ncbi:MAG TPA: Abi-alpha family protein [Candidatus Angelobacter sp.]|nr:Abi-alpha family protein [Candidatus Angelobacter sp.]